MDFGAHEWTLIGGLAVGALLGASVQRSNFCMMGAVADFAINRDLRRLRGWMLAIAVAIAGSQVLHLSGALDLSTAFYRQPTLPWGSLVLGGALFGFGMVIACGCASRSLVNLAAGDLRALVALLCVAVCGYATARGLLVYPRLWLNDALNSDLTLLGFAGQGLPDLFEGGAEATATATVAASLLVCAPLLRFALGGGALGLQRRELLAAVAVGSCIPLGWFVTGVLGADPFEPAQLVSLRFVAPTGNALQYLMTFSGSHADFGIASVAGVLLGAALAARASGSFAWRGFEDLRELGNYLAGGALMGIGGVLAMGCTVGQGLSGVSTLSLGSFLALAGIIGGGVLGVRYLEQGSVSGVVKAALGRG